MRFTGKNLVWIGYALSLAQDEVHNLIATCPDVKDHANNIAELERDKAQLERMQIAVANAIAKEQEKRS